MKSTLMDSVQEMSNTGKHIRYLDREILPPCYEDESLNTNCEREQHIPERVVCHLWKDRDGKGRGLADDEKR